MLAWIIEHAVLFSQEQKETEMKVITGIKSREGKKEVHSWRCQTCHRLRKSTLRPHPAAPSLSLWFWTPRRFVKNISDFALSLINLLIIYFLIIQFICLVYKMSENSACHRAQSDVFKSQTQRYSVYSYNWWLPSLSINLSKKLATHTSRVQGDVFRIHFYPTNRPKPKAIQFTMI